MHYQLLKMLHQKENLVRKLQSFLTKGLCQRPYQYKVCYDAENIFLECQGF